VTASSKLGRGDAQACDGYSRISGELADRRVEWSRQRAPRPGWPARQQAARRREAVSWVGALRPRISGARERRACR